MLIARAAAPILSGLRVRTRTMPQVLEIGRYISIVHIGRPPSAPEGVSILREARAARRKKAACSRNGRTEQDHGNTFPHHGPAYLMGRNQRRRVSEDSAMKLRHSLTLGLLVAGIGWTSPVHAQAVDGGKVAPLDDIKNQADLDQAITALATKLFDAYNHCDLKTF